jgi:hypothetical protein
MSCCAFRSPATQSGGGDKFPEPDSRQGERDPGLGGKERRPSLLRDLQGRRRLPGCARWPPLQQVQARAQVMQKGVIDPAPRQQAALHVVHSGRGPLQASRAQQRQSPLAVGEGVEQVDAVLVRHPEGAVQVAAGRFVLGVKGAKNAVPDFEADHDHRRSLAWMERPSNGSKGSLAFIEISLVTVERHHEIADGGLLVGPQSALDQMQGTIRPDLQHRMFGASEHDPEAGREHLYLDLRR